MEVQNPNKPLKLVYYALRGKVQTIRLLCEHLGVPYQDVFFDPEQWCKYKASQKMKAPVKDIPFLEDGDFILTGVNAMTNYIVELANREDLLGKSLIDKSKIDAFRYRQTLQSILSIISRIGLPRNPVKNQGSTGKNYRYEQKLTKLLEFHEEQAMEGGYFLEYQTIADFAIYEMMNISKWLIPHLINKLPKLKAISSRVASLPTIDIYESSRQAVKELCPVRYFKNFKTQKRRMLRLMRSNETQDTER